MARTGADIKTTTFEIVDYWSTRIDEGDLGVDWCDANERCWRCGDKRGLERCHIIPAQEPFCGSNSPENLVLLCKPCHEEAPSCIDPAEIWTWIKLTKVGTYEAYWSQRDQEEIKRIYGLDIAKELFVREVLACVEAYKTISEHEVGIHFCSRPFSVASKAFVWRKVFSQVLPNRN